MTSRAAAVVVALAGACSHAAPAPAPGPVFAPDAAPEAASADAGAMPEDAGAAALAAEGELVELSDGKDRVGFVSVPIGAREPRPIVIALHGGSERPERACRAWRAITDAYPFVVCPRGFGGDERRLGWRTTSDTIARIARALAAAKQAFGAWMKETRTVVLVGFSMGGSQVANVARADPATYRRIVVGDSAHDPRPALSFAHAWASGGGERALFLCTTSGCEPALRMAARKVGEEKVAARLNVSPTRKHALAGRAIESMRRDWPWLVEGAEGWDGYAAPADLATLGGRTESFGE